MAINLKQIIPWGRSFDEYRRMFDLSPADLAGRLLGCGDGPASFNAEATAQGIRVISFDPIYSFDRSQIEQRVRDCHDDLIAQVWNERAGFVWTDFRDPNHLGRCRMQAMRRFLDDFEEGKRAGRYIAASLPSLPFGPGQFDLALVSHLLLLYSDRLDLDFHWSSIVELLRLADEARIFPVLTLARTRSPHLNGLLDRCAVQGWTAEIRRVPYEFQRGGNEMLRVRKFARTCR